MNAIANTYHQLIQRLQAAGYNHLQYSNYLNPATTAEQLLESSRKIQSAVTPIQRVPSVAITQFRPLDIIVAHTQPVIFISSPVTQASALAVYPDPGPEEPDWSIKFNKKKLDVEMVHTLSHGKPIGCVQFSRDGKYLAAGCYDGKAYIYDVETGTLTW